MSKLSQSIVAVVSLGLFACTSPAPAGKTDKQAKTDGKSASAKAADPAPVEPKPIAPTTGAPVEPPPQPDVATGEPPEPTADPLADAEPPSEPAAGAWKAPEGVDIRSDAAIPPGTPAANAEAFKALAQTKVDGPPVSGIASNGLHFDSLVLGRGWEKSHCLEATSTFKLDVDDRVNICVRAVHPPDAAETLTVEWSKVGTKTVRKSSIVVKAMHAYLTRGYLPIKTGYEGDWTAVVKAPDGTVLATLPFTVE